MQEKDKKLKDNENILNHQEKTIINKTQEVTNYLQEVDEMQDQIN